MYRNTQSPLGSLLSSECKVESEEKCPKVEPTARKTFKDKLMPHGTRTYRKFHGYTLTRRMCEIGQLKLKILSSTALLFILMGRFYVESSQVASNNSSSKYASSAQWRTLNEKNTSQDHVATGGNCSTCSSFYRNAARERRIEEFKTEILNKLGFKSEPKINMIKVPSLPPINEIMDKLGIYSGIASDGMDNEMVMDMSQGEEEESDDYEDFYVNTKRSITFAQKLPSHLNISSELKAQYFQFSSKVYNSHVAKANLWVHVKQLPQLNESDSWQVNDGDTCAIRKNTSVEGSENKVAWIVVYQVVKSDMQEGPTLLHVRAQKVSVPSQPGAAALVKVDVKKLVSQWLINPASNLGMVIHSLNNDGCVLEIGTAEASTGSDLQVPFIEVRVDTRSQTRQRRMIGLTCDENSTETRCCRYPLVIDFDQMGWNWIIAPRKYEAHFCSGECLASFSQHTHSHLVNQATFGRNNLCCIPRKMSSISMLYYDENYNINQGTLPGMVVERCGCV